MNDPMAMKAIINAVGTMLSNHRGFDRASSWPKAVP
jgi:hypothetical protein